MNITEKNILSRIHIRLALVNIGGNTLRSYPEGTKEKIRIFLCEEIKPSEVKKALQNEQDYLCYIKFKTDLLTIVVQNWGISRKAINMFLRDMIYNKEYSDYLFSKNEENRKLAVTFMHPPIDSMVVKELQKINNKLPGWTNYNALQTSYEKYIEHLKNQSPLDLLNSDLIYWNKHIIDKYNQLIITNI
jgi:hypothetical protein